MGKAMTTLNEMLSAARDAMSKAYVPYSHFRVGAVIKAASGKMYVGCNVENASYPVGSCAEQSAISAMIMGGDTSAIKTACAKPSRWRKCYRCPSVPKISRENDGDD